MTEELREVVGDLVAEHHVPGCVAGLVVDGEVHLAAVGVTDVEHPRPLDPATLFQVGSVTKTFTSTVVGLLVEEGRVAWDDPLARRLPGLAAQLRPGLDLGAITVEQALSHRSGFDGDHLFVRREGHDLGALADVRHLFAPGEGYSYSNAGFSLAGALVEAADGRPFPDSVAARLLAPLGLDGACFTADAAITRPVALPHWVVGGEAYLLRGAGWQPGWELTPVDHAAGGLVASVAHLLTWGRAQIDGTAADGSTLLSTELRRTLHTPVVEADALHGIALDWFVREVDGVTTIGHGGLTAGYATNLRIVPERGVVLAVCTHATNGGAVNHRVTRWALERAAGLALRDPDPDPDPGPDPTAAPDPAWAAGTYLGPFGRHTVTAGDDPGTLVVTTEARSELAWQPPPDPPVTIASTSPTAPAGTAATGAVDAVDAISVSGADPARLARLGPVGSDRAEWLLWGDRRCPRVG